MGRKRKRQIFQGEDPIVKRIHKRKQKQQQQDNNIDNIDDDYDDEQEIEEQQIHTHIVNYKNNNEQTTHYDEFLEAFNIKDKKQKNIEIEYDNQNSSIKAKQLIKQNKLSQFSKVKSYQITNINIIQQQHFEKDYQEIRNTICEQQQIQQLQESNQLNQFFKEEKQKLSTTLNNGVIFKQYQLNQKLKLKQLIDLKLDQEDYHIEQLSIPYLINNKQFNLQIDSNNDYQSVQSALINNYFDFIRTDPEEEQAKQFRQIYSNHVIQHLRQNRTTYGFTRCKVLILTAFKGDAVAIIEQLIQGTEIVLNKERYEKEFCDDDRLMEDDFRIGLQFAKNGAIKLHADFDKSDIIIASVLGLRLIVGEDGQKNREFHFLSSIEILVIDRASAIFMQNWNHLETVLESINQLPEHKHITQDIHQIREYCFENMSKFYRQTIIYTNHYFQELNYIRRVYCNNYKGCISNKVYYMPKLRDADSFQQEFRNFDCTSMENSIEQRQMLFKKLWTDLENKQLNRTLIFVQQYYDFVKLKNHFKKSNSLVECVSEYTKKSKVQSIISKFKANKIKYIMITERAYYFEICQLRQMKNVIFYQLPQHSFIYKMIIQDLEELNVKSLIISFYSKFDAYVLEPIVGSVKAEEMLQEDSKGTTFII